MLLTPFDFAICARILSILSLSRRNMTGLLTSKCLSSSGLFLCSNYGYNIRSRVGTIPKGPNQFRRRGNIQLAFSPSSVNSIIAPVLLALAVVFPSPDDTFLNVPPTLSGDDKKQVRLQRPKTKTAERCTSKCVGTCIQGGAGSPGEGPFNVRRPLVVFKEQFRSRRYCLRECADICNLIKDGDDGP